MYRFVKSRFHSTVLALKSQDIKYCGSEFYFGFFTMYNSWGNTFYYFILLHGKRAIISCL